MIARVRRVNHVRLLLGLAWVQKLIKAHIDRTVKGPDEEQRAQTPTFVWGEVTNASGRKETARIRIANSYSVTITGALAVVEHLLAGHSTGGAYTPSRLLDADLVTRLPRSGKMEISREGE